MFVFARDSMKDRITRVNYDSVKLGFMGSIGNKVINNIYEREQ